VSYNLYVTVIRPYIYIMHVAAEYIFAIISVLTQLFERCLIQMLTGFLMTNNKWCELLERNA